MRAAIRTGRACAQVRVRLALFIPLSLSLALFYKLELCIPPKILPTALRSPPGVPAKTPALAQNLIKSNFNSKSEIAIFADTVDRIGLRSQLENLFGVPQRHQNQNFDK